MKTFISTILIGALLLVQQATCGDVPDVKSIDCRKTSLPSTNFEECLIVTMNQDPIVFAGLVGIHDSDQVLQGSLYSEDGEELEDTHVSVTKDDDEPEAHVIILLMENSEQLAFELDCDLATGICKKHPIHIGADDKHVDQVMRIPVSEEDMAPLDRQRKTLPPNGFKLKVQFMYDQSFARKFNGDANQISKAIDKILVHANSYFKLKSLTTKIDLDTTGLPYYALDRTLTATGPNVNQLRRIVNSFPKIANSYTVLSFENNQGGTVGIAYGGTTCASERGVRININEHLRDDMTTAAIVVHEIGHNLGMEHDFGTQGDGFTNTAVKRFSKSGKACSQIEGFMDYYNEKTTKWSPCSVDDFTDYYNRVRTWCLPELSGGPNPPVRPTNAPKPPTKAPKPPTKAPKPPTRAPQPPSCKDDLPPIFCNPFICGIDFIKGLCKKTCKLC